jgi:hypothetical protein
MGKTVHNKRKAEWDWAMSRLMGTSALKWAFFPQVEEKEII